MYKTKTIPGKKIDNVEFFEHLRIENGELSIFNGLRYDDTYGVSNYTFVEF